MLTPLEEMTSLLLLAAVSHLSPGWYGRELLLLPAPRKPGGMIWPFSLPYSQRKTPAWHCLQHLVIVKINQIIIQILSQIARNLALISVN